MRPRRPIRPISRPWLWEWVGQWAELRLWRQTKRDSQSINQPQTAVFTSLHCAFLQLIAWLAVCFGPFCWFAHVFSFSSPLLILHMVVGWDQQDKILTGNFKKSIAAVAPGDSPKRGVPSKKVKGPLFDSGGGQENLSRGEYCLFSRRPNLEGGKGPLVSIVQAPLHRGWHRAASKKPQQPALASLIAPPLCTNQAEWLVCIIQWELESSPNKPIKIHALTTFPAPSTRSAVLWHDLIQQLLRLLLFLKERPGSLRHQRLQILCVFLHALQQIIHNIPLLMQLTVFQTHPHRVARRPLVRLLRPTTLNHPCNFTGNVGGQRRPKWHRLLRVGHPRHNLLKDGVKSASGIFTFIWIRSQTDFDMKFHFEMKNFIFFKENKSSNFVRTAIWKHEEKI